MHSIDLLKRYDIKVTPHKLAVLELFTTHKHLDANQIIRLLNKNSSNISSATVYRILANFEQHSVISKHNFGNDQAIYELNQNENHHDHLICLSCGVVIEFNNPQIEEIQIQIAQANNFSMLSHNLNIYGHCKNCSGKEP
jgi:Fur family ferric uptake transcriptional regulator